MMLAWARVVKVMPKRRKNRYNEHQFRDEYTRIRAPGLSVFSGLDHLLALAIRTSEESPVHHFRLIPSRSKDLERTEPPYLHTPPISMSCSPLPPPSAPLSPSRSCFFPQTVFDANYNIPVLLVRIWKIYIGSSIEVTFFSPPRTCFSTPSSSHLCNFQFLEGGRRGRSLRL